MGSYGNVVILIGGRDGAEEELDEVAQQAEANGDKLTVIPVAFTGGTARRRWDEMRWYIKNEFWGGKPVSEADFVNLNSTNPDEVIEATVRLITQALS